MEIKGWIFILMGFFWMAFTTYGAFDIRANYFVKTYFKGNTTNKKIAITFDDGPTPFTNSVLDILKKHNATATFFCIGRQIEKYPEIAKRIVEEGHIIANHSYTHSNAIGFFSTEKMINEIKHNQEVIKKYTGKVTQFYRPPFGVTNPKIARATQTTNQIVIGWNNRSLDTVIDDENKILKRIKNKVNPGGIILLHDTSNKTVNVLEQLLLFLQSENYEVTSLEELLNLKAYED